MAKQLAMSLQARRAGPVVATGISLATAGILVAVPAIVPPLTARDAQVAADVQHGLSTAQVKLAALSDALLAFTDGGPVGALLAGLFGPDFQTAFQDGGPVGALLFALAGDNEAAQGLAAAFQNGGPVGALLFATIGEEGRAAFQDGGPVGLALTALIGPDLTAAFQGGGPVGLALTALIGPDLTAAFQDGGPVGLLLSATVGEEARAAFQDGGPVGLALTALIGPDLTAAFQNGGPVGLVLNVLAGALTPPTTTSATTLAAQPGAGTSITSIAGLFGTNAEANTGRSFVNLSTPSLAGAGTTGAGTTGGAGTTTGAGTKGSDEGNRLVRNSPKFSPEKNTTILPVGSQSGAGAGGWNLFQGIKDAFGGLTGGGGSLTGPANATDSGAGNGDEKG